MPGSCSWWVCWQHKTGKYNSRYAKVCAGSSSPPDTEKRDVSDVIPGAVLVTPPLTGSHHSTTKGAGMAAKMTIFSTRKHNSILDFGV